MRKDAAGAQTISNISVSVFDSESRRMFVQGSNNIFQCVTVGSVVVFFQWKMLAQLMYITKNLDGTVAKGRRVLFVIYKGVIILTV